MNRTDNLLAAGVATIWGLNFVVIEVGMRGVPPLLFLAARFLLVVFPLVFLVPRPQVGWRTVVGVGLFMSLGQFAFLYLSMAAGLSPGIAALVLQAQVMVTIVLAAGVLGERPSNRQWWGVLLGTVGLVVVALGRGGEVTLVALGLCLLGAVSWGIGNVVSRAGGAAGGLSLTVWSALVVPVPLLVATWWSGGTEPFEQAWAAIGWAPVLSTLYTAGLASLIGYAVFNSLLARHPSAAVVPWILLAPVVAMASAWLFLGQVPAPGELLGGAVLLVGVLVATRPVRVTGGAVPPTRSSRPRRARSAPVGR